MRRSFAFITTLFIMVALAPAATAHHVVEWPDGMPRFPSPGKVSMTDGGEHSDNMALVGHWTVDPQQFADEDEQNGVTNRRYSGTDLAFWKNLAVVGQYSNPGGFYLLDITDRAHPSYVGRFDCPGPQNDVSIWGDLIFVSVDTPQKSAECGSGSASATDTAQGGENHWEGIRIISIADRSQPTQVGDVYTDCGSHTHTLVPDLRHRDPETRRPDPRVLVYSLSYPLGGQGADCNAASHRKFSVVAVPLSRPQDAEVVSTPDVSPAIGCHDVTVFPEKGLAGAACITETQIWDIADPVDPTIVSRIRNPAMEIHHSTTFSWDGDVLVIGDEMGGAAAAVGCVGHGHVPTGSLWFYDISDPAAPTQASSYNIPEFEPSFLCTAHNFNTVPLRSDQRILTTAWYRGGTHVLDFTDPSNVQRIAHHVPDDEAGEASAWSSYWYNGAIFANNFDEGYVPPIQHSRGFDVFAVDHPFVDDAVRLPFLNAQTQMGPPSLEQRRPASGVRPER